MIKPSYDIIESLSKEYSILPLCKEINGDIITPITLLHKISQVSKQYYLLESVEGGETWGRYSFIGFSPILQISCKNHEVTIKDDDVKTFHSERPLEVVRELLSKYQAPKLEGMPPFTGGLMGYFSYEMMQYSEPTLNLKDSSFPDMNLMLFDKIIAYDHFKQAISLIVNIQTEHLAENYRKGLEDLAYLQDLITSPLSLHQGNKNSQVDFTCNVSKQEFTDMVLKGKQYITQGDITQVVVSRRFESPYSDSLMDAYRLLRVANPSPYMVYMQDDDVELICTSPETLVRLQDGKLLTFPIAGSRPRGKNPVEDLALEQELLADKKELSEHNMLVDLAKYDLEKISDSSSIQVTDYKGIRRYSKIMHITSQVESNISPNLDGLDAIEALLPAGTLSGSPKTRACEIIDELENIPRGIYGGAIGYIDFTGNMDTCIAIRMAVKSNDKVYVQAGCGIVADSIPEKEYEETEHKAKAILEAIMNASEVESQ